MPKAYGPDGTAIDGVTALALAVSPINIAEDFRLLSDEPGDATYVDVSAPLGQTATIRISLSEKANMYAGSSIDSSGFLPNKKALEGRVEVREIWRITDATDTTYQKFAPARFTLAYSVPQSETVSADIIHLLTRAIAALSAANVDGISDGVTDMLHGVAKKA